MFIAGTVTMLLLAVVLAGCDSAAGPGHSGSGPILGSITFTGLDPGYNSADIIGINSNPAIVWGADYAKPDVEIWCPTVIGEGGGRLIGNKLVIHAEKYEKLNGVWVPVLQFSGKNDFTYTGNCSVYINFFSSSGGMPGKQIGLNNVPFVNGEASVDISGM